jgi:hypothetical protein
MSSRILRSCRQQRFTRTIVGKCRSPMFVDSAFALCSDALSGALRETVEERLLFGVQVISPQSLNTCLLLINLDALSLALHTRNLRPARLQSMTDTISVFGFHKSFEAFADAYLWLCAALPALGGQ